MAKKEVKQGDVAFVKLDPIVGSEQGGTRLCIVVQRNEGNQNSTTTYIVPLTKQQKNFNLTHYTLYKTLYPFLTYDSNVLAEQLRTVDIKRIERIVGHIEHYDLQRIINKIIENMKTS